MAPRWPASERDIARESVFVALGLVALYAFVIWLSDGQIVITRPLWVDEVWTVLVSRQQSPMHVVGALSAGADGGTGLVHLGVWALQKVVGFPSPTLLRVMSLGCVAVALCLVYAVLRRRFGRDASVAGMLAVGANALVVTHTFEARFYGPWLLCCAFFAWALGRHQAMPSRPRATVLAVAAALLSLVHFYGVITLALMVGGAVASHGRRWREGVRLVAPAATGVVAFLALVPLAVDMRNSLAVPTWVPDFELRQLRGVASQLWWSKVPLLFAAALVVGGIVGAVRRAPRSVSTIAHSAALDAGILSLAALALVPIAMAVVSAFGQGSMLLRYNIATTLFWAPLVAVSMELCGRRAALVAGLVLVGFWYKAFVDVRFEKIVFGGDVQEVEAAVQLARATGAPIVFQSVHTWYPLWARDSAAAASMPFLEVSDATYGSMFQPGTPSERYNRQFLLDRGIVRAHSRRFGVPRLVTQATLDTTRRFVLIAMSGHLPRGFQSIEKFSGAVFPDHRVTQLDFNSALLERTPTTGR